MTPEEYESYVAEVVRQLEGFSSAKIKRNNTIRGVRRPGKYEIDISAEFELGDALRFLLIIECKNWSRPVDRPVVQRLIQTRDAISAQKAAIVSPQGFTREAVSVAAAHGVALWVITAKEFHTVLYCKEAPLPELLSARRLRFNALEAIGYCGRDCSSFPLLRAEDAQQPREPIEVDGKKIFVSFGRINTKSHLSKLRGLPLCIRYGDEASVPDIENWDTAVHEIASDIFKHLQQRKALTYAGNPIALWRERERWKWIEYVEEDYLNSLLDSIVSGGFLAPGGIKYTLAGQRKLREMRDDYFSRISRLLQGP